MAQIRFANLVPLGKIAIAAAGSPAALSQNCGPLGGQKGTNWQAIPVPGTACQQFTIQAAAANGGNLYLLPRGNTASANPSAIMAVLSPGSAITFPAGLAGPGLLPENMVLDTDAGSGTQYAYGYGVLVG